VKDKLLGTRDSRAAAAIKHAAFALAASLILLSPMFLTGRTFGPDWTNHLWVMNAQADSISSGGPSLFLHADQIGVFYPHFAFYGGTLYTVGGAISAALGGHSVIAYLLLWLAGFLMAYGGMFWLSVEAGLDGWQAHVAPLILLTSAFYVTNAFARGVLPELIAVSAIPLLLAATLSMLRAPKLTFGPCAAFVVAAIVFTGSHNLTLVWGTVAIAALGVVAILAVPALRRVSPRRLLTIAALGALAVAANAWFLLPDLVYANRTVASGPGAGLVYASDFFNTSANLFSVVRHAPAESTTADLDTQLPVLVGLWVLLAAGLCVRFGISKQSFRIAAGIGAVLALFLGLLMMNWPWEHLPTTLTIIQFSYRLESYVVIALALLVVVLLRATDLWSGPGRSAARAVQIGLVVIVAGGFVQAVVQGWETGSFRPPKGPQQTRSEALASSTKLPSAWYAGGDYRDRSAPLLTAPKTVRVPPAKVKDDRATLELVGPAGQLTATNVAGGDYLVKVSGARQAGRDGDGFEVLAATEAGTKPVRVVVQSRNPPAVVLGKWITIAALLTLITAMLVCGYRAIAGRRGAA
jgi:hypothetical protein